MTGAAPSGVVTFLLTDVEGLPNAPRVPPDRPAAQASARAIIGGGSSERAS